MYEMPFVYVVIENGEPYPIAYTEYLTSVKAVKNKHKITLEKQIGEARDLSDIEEILANINVPETLERSISYLYVEKEINILIHRLPY